jgi:uncharacterized membrane protein YkvA (DUF1232 family)
MSRMSRLRAVATRFKDELVFYRRVVGHRRTPRLARILLGAAIGYALMPFDVIPDFLPVVGHLDDLIIVPLIVVFAMKLVPRDVVAECRDGAAPR